MRRRDWLRSIAALAVVPLVGVRRTVAAAETVTETLPAVTPAPPAAETVTGEAAQRDASRTGELLPVFGGSLNGNVWHYGYGRGLLMVPTHGAVVSGIACEWYERKMFATVLAGGLQWEHREAWVYIGNGPSCDPPPRGQMAPGVREMVQAWLMGERINAGVPRNESRRAEA